MSQRARASQLDLQAPRLSDPAGSQSLKRKERPDDRRHSLGRSAQSPLTLVPAGKCRAPEPSPLSLARTPAGPPSSARPWDASLPGSSQPPRRASQPAGFETAQHVRHQSALPRAQQPPAAAAGLAGDAPAELPTLFDAITARAAAAADGRGGAGACPAPPPLPFRQPSAGESGGRGGGLGGGGSGAQPPRPLRALSAGSAALERAGADALAPPPPPAGAAKPAAGGGGDPFARFVQRVALNAADSKGASREARALRAAGAAPAARGLASAPLLPWDWSLKANVALSSRAPLEWCARLSTEAEGHGLRGACGGGEAAGDGGAHDEAAFAQALFYWSFGQPPAAKGGGGASDALGGGGDAAAAARAQLAVTEWLEALRSAYFQMRNGHCPYFYTTLPALGAGVGAGGSALTILWRNAKLDACAAAGAADGRGGGAFAPVGELSSAEVYAVCTAPSAGFVESLRQGDVPFTRATPPPAAPPRPAAPSWRAADSSRSGGGGGEEDEDEDEDDGLPAGVAVRGGVAASDGLRGSGPLLFEGHSGVHGLLDVLMMAASAQLAAGARLHAPAPFVNACCRRLRVQRAGPLLQRAASLGGAHGALALPRTEHVHCIEFVGTVLPGALRALCAALEARQDGCFKLRALPADGSAQLNLAAPLVADETRAAPGAEGAAPGASAPVAFTEVERLGPSGQWQLTLPSAAGRRG